MKKVFFLFVLTLVYNNSIAQTSKKTTGPKAKNAKVWDDKKTETIVLVNSFEKSKLVGPRLKNEKIWDKKISKEKVVLKIEKNRKALIGPEAKNYKPWQKN